MSRKGKQTTLGSSLDSLMVRLDRKNQGAYQQVRIAQAWAAVAGESVTAHTCQAHLRDGQLVVFVDSALWATELSALSEPYRIRLNEELGQELVTSVRFTVSRHVNDHRRFEAQQREVEEFYQPDQTQPVPLSQSELDQVTASAEAIEDERLREAVLRATITDLEWKKGIEATKSPQKPRGGR